MKLLKIIIWPILAAILLPVIFILVMMGDR